MVPPRELTAIFFIYTQENVSFFLEACKKLELQDSQLFDSQDLLGTKSRSEKDLRCAFTVVLYRVNGFAVLYLPYLA